MDVDQVHAIERECAKVLMQSRPHGDMQEFEKYVALFTPDVVFKNGDKEPVVGSEANVADMKANIGDLFMRCVITNILVTVIDADNAAATSYWMMYRHKKADVDDGKVTSVELSRFCESEDTFVRTEEGWRIAKRKFRAVL